MWAGAFSVCSDCGSLKPDAVAVCPGCNAEVVAIAPPDTTARSRDLVCASIGCRLAAALLDSVFASALLAPLTLLFIWLMQAFHLELGLSEYKSQVVAGSAAVVLCIIGHWLYCARAEASARQATLGKRLMRLKVVNTDYAPVTFGQATWRHFAKFLSTFALFAGFVLAFFNHRRQTLHDVIAGTLVVRSA